MAPLEAVSHRFIIIYLMQWTVRYLWSVRGEQFLWLNFVLSIVLTGSHIQSLHIVRNSFIIIIHLTFYNGEHNIIGYCESLSLHWKVTVNLCLCTETLLWIFVFALKGYCESLFLHWKVTVNLCFCTERLLWIFVFTLKGYCESLSLHWKVTVNLCLCTERLLWIFVFALKGYC